MQTKPSIRTLCSKLVLGSLVLAGSIARVAALDGIVIAQPDVPVTSLSADALKDVLTGKTTYWQGGQAVVIVTMSEKTDAALQQASGMSASQFKTFWQRLAFSGRGQQPKSADDAEKAMSMVSSTKGAISIVPTGTELKGVKQIEIK